MLVVVPFCGKDVERAIELLVWMRKLDGKQDVPHACLLVGDWGMHQEQHDRVKAAAYDAFTQVYDCTADNPEPRGWPFGPNLMFKTAMAYVRQKLKRDFFWCEPDCIPVKKGWLSALEAAHVAGVAQGMKFTGFIHNKPWLHLTGCAVYPWNMYEINMAPLMANSMPWDVVAPQSTMELTCRTDLIQHVWSYQGDKLDSPAPSFPTIASLGQVSAEAVVFHRNKDGTLIERLSGESGRQGSETMIKGDTCIVQLGRYGDILNILPVVKRMGERWAKPTVMVAAQFADIMDGLTYADVRVFDGGYDEVERAVALARKEFELVVVTQVWGKTWRPARGAKSYNMDSWRLAGYLGNWVDPSMKLDLCRNMDVRTVVPQKLAGYVGENARPYIAVSLSSGHSSPFAEWGEVQQYLLMTYGDHFDFVDLAQMKLERVTELLPWIAGAAVLVTSDTAALHLAAACATPVVALVNDDPWLATVPRCNCVLRVSYAEAVKRLPEMIRVINALEVVA